MLPNLQRPQNPQLHVLKSSHPKIITMAIQWAVKVW